jgi:electron transport complex protein RnfC
MVPEATEVCRAGQIEILPIPAEYPETLEPLVALRAGGEGVARVVTLEAALAALDAVRDGKVQQSKVLTVIGREGKPVANYRVPLGTRIKEVLSAAGIETHERDKVLAGGPMRGFAQYSLSGAVDAGVDAITVIPASDVVPWSEEPCINCGLCIDACPTNLQVQLISRYAEFELFDRTPELDIDQCIECGLCASVCTGRRPLVQLIRLAKREVEAAG